MWPNICPLTRTQILTHTHSHRSTNNRPASKRYRYFNAACMAHIKLALSIRPTNNLFGQHSLFGCLIPSMDWIWSVYGLYMEWICSWPTAVNPWSQRQPKSTRHSAKRQTNTNPICIAGNYFVCQHTEGKRPLLITLYIIYNKLKIALYIDKSI